MALNGPVVCDECGYGLFKINRENGGPIFVCAECDTEFSVLTLPYAREDSE